MVYVMPNSARRVTLAQGPGTPPGTPVDLKIAFWGISLLLAGIYLLGSEHGSRGSGRRQRSEPAPTVDGEAVSALVNLGYSRASSERAVKSARRRGAKGFDEVVRQSLKQFER